MNQLAKYEKMCPPLCENQYSQEQAAIDYNISICIHLWNHILASGMDRISMYFILFKCLIYKSYYNFFVYIIIV